MRLAGIACRYLMLADALSERSGKPLRGMGTFTMILLVSKETC